MNEYPKWIKVPGKGHPQMPGHALVETEEQERETIATGVGPRDLNPPNDEDVKREPLEMGTADGTVVDANATAEDKPLEDQAREELIAALVRETLTDKVSDDNLRAAIEHARETGAKFKAPDDDGDPEPRKDAAGNEMAPDPAAEANKGDPTKPKPGAPEAKSSPATDSTPKESADKIADDKPVGNVTAAAATPADHKKGASKAPGVK